MKVLNFHACPASVASARSSVQAAQPGSSTQATKRVHRHAHGVATGSQKPVPADAGYGTGHRHHHPHHTAAARHTHSGLDHSHSTSSCPICLDLAVGQVLVRPVRWRYGQVLVRGSPGTSKTCMNCCCRLPKNPKFSASLAREPRQLGTWQVRLRRLAHTLIPHPSLPSAQSAGLPAATMAER